MDIIEVTWLDATCEESHLPPEAAKDLPVLRRVNWGRYLVADEVKITIAYGEIENFHKGEKAYDMTMSIPRGMIESIRELK